MEGLSILTKFTNQSLENPALKPSYNINHSIRSEEQKWGRLYNFRKII